MYKKLGHAARLSIDFTVSGAKFILANTQMTVL